MATHVYIDGFNLYYGCVKHTKYRWLDLAALCARLLPKDDIQMIRYFTAPISARSYDPDGPVRQQTYLRALRTLPKLEIHLGSFLVKPTTMPLETPPSTGSRMVRVIKSEEKGSDVALASHLLIDAMRKRCQTAVVISNDSDLTEAVRLARYELGVTVGVINPHPPQKRSRELSQHAHFFKQIRPNAIRDGQFPDELTDAHGTFRRPKEW